MILLVPSLAWGQVPPAAQETIDQLQNSPGLTISTAQPCCKPSIWDCLGVQQMQDHCHETLHKIAELPLFKSLLQTLNTGLQAAGLAPPAEGGPGAPGAPGAGGADPAAGGGAAGGVAAKIEADKKAADAKVATLEYLGQQDCNAYPEIIPALLEALDDPIERVRYAALVALMRQCKELRCSTLPATRLKYRLHDESFIDHCRQCASCACQQTVIKRLSDLLLDETALGYPKENSPRVRSLAASIIERCLQVHPVAPPDETQKTQGVQPDPPPAPLPDPTASDDGSARVSARFPAAPLFRTRPSGERGGWLRRLLGDRRPADGRQANRRWFQDRPVFRGQSPETVFEATPEGGQFRGMHTWSAAAPAADPAIGGLPLPADADVPLPPRNDWTDAGAPATDAAPVAGDDWSRVEMLHQIVAESEATIRATAAERDGAAREQFEDAVAALCGARLALALDGDQAQLGSLYDDAVALCQNTPNSVAAATALDGLTRYYGARAGATTPAGIDALRQYADCLEYRITRFDTVPADVPQALYQAARALHRAGLTEEAVQALQHVVANSPDAMVAADAAALISEVESPTSTVELASSHEGAGIQGGIVAFDHGVGGAGPVASTPAPVPPAEWEEAPAPAVAQTAVPAHEWEQVQTPPQAQPAEVTHTERAPAAAEVPEATPQPEMPQPEPVSETVRLQGVIAAAERSARASFSNRNGHGRQAFETAVANLCEARLQLALAGDQQQFQELNDDAEGLSARDPGSHAAAIALHTLARYYEAQSGEDTEEQRAALRQYATCLRYFLVNFESPPEDVPARLVGASHALRRIGCPDEAAACLQRITTYCGGTPVAGEAALLLAEYHPAADGPTTPTPPVADGSTAPSVAAAPQVSAAPEAVTETEHAPATESAPAGPDAERAWLYDSVAQAEQTIRATFAQRSGPAKAEFESALTLLCEARLQLALQGDQLQFEELYDDAETLCREAPSSEPARIAMEALTAYYGAHAGESTAAERDALRRYAGCLRFRVSRFPAEASQCAQHLLDAGEMLARCEIEDDAAASFRTVAKHCPGTSHSQVAQASLQSLAPASGTAAQETVAHADNTRTSGPEPTPARPTPARTDAAESPVVTVGGNEPIAAPAADPAPLELGHPEVAEVPLPLGPVATSTALQAPPPPPAPAADGLPPLPADAAPEPATMYLEPIEDPFGPNPLGRDVVKLAQEALQANEFAYLHLQEEDDILERYNNSIGIKIAPYSLFHIDSAQTGNVFRMRFASVFDYHRPDRSEYFWKGIDGRGPAAAATSPPRAETGLDYQQIYIYNETAPSEFASAFTEYPIWILDPEQNANTAGPGDITIGLKAVMIKDENWTVTSLTKTYTPVGTPGRGLGRGHLALEQGVAVLLRAGRRMYLHSDLKFHYPIAADADHGGEVLIGGIGFSRVLWTDPIAPPIGRSRALILTGETVITSFLDGLVTEPAQPRIAVPGARNDLFTPRFRSAEMTSVIQNFGLRAVWTKRFSTGWSVGFPISTSHTHDFSTLFELQWIH